ncbi:pilus assembly protein, partial [Craterilacuibacter sp.]|uniref:pilus assembly protein n=1 Tax=Craterilacuibacter sp. TaxID=2870909 RepID=UPI003F300737
RYYVDGPVQAAEVCLKDGNAYAARSVLVGSTGAGGSSLFALDVTRGKDFSKSDVLWEFGAADDAGFGVAVSQPQLVKLRDGVGADGKPKARYAVIAGNGLNQAAGAAGLYIIYLDRPAAGGKPVYRRIPVAADPSGATVRNGLMNPSAVDNDGDGITDYVYAGDIQGRLWKFDLRDNSPANWKVANGTATAPLPLFEAHVLDQDGNGKDGAAQPIVAAPLVIRHPAGGLQLLFGTGALFNDSDRGSTNPNYFYGLRDPLDGTTLGTSATAGLSAQALGEQLSASKLYQDSSRNVCGSKGWYLPMANLEKTTYRAAIVQGRVQFTSLQLAGDNCSSSGKTWITEVEAFCGKAPSKPIFDTNGDGKVNGSDQKASRYRQDELSGEALNLLAPGFTVLRFPGGISESRYPARVSWREIIRTK